MTTNPFEPPKEVTEGAIASIAPIIWLLIGIAAATALLWPCLMMTVLAILPPPNFGPGEDGYAIRAEVEMRLVVSGAVSLPVAVIGSLLIMLAGTRRRKMDR